MDMTDQEFDQLLGTIRRVAARIIRPLALGGVAFVLSYSQAHFAYPSLVVGLLVFVLSASNYAARFAYGIIFYLVFLVLMPPDVANALSKGVADLWQKIK